jgi:hypothetical protein
MKKEEKLEPGNIEPEFGKKLYSVKESYWIFYNGIRTMKYMPELEKPQTKLKIHRKDYACGYRSE